MKKRLLFLLFFLLFSINFYGKSNDILPLDLELRTRVLNTGSTIEDQKELWNNLKKRLIPFSTQPLNEENLDNNMKILYYAMQLLLVREPMTSYNLFLLDIAKEAEETYNLAKKFINHNKKVSPNFLLSYANLMFMITPIINRIDRKNPIINPKGYITQYDEFERMRDIGDTLIRDNKNNLGYLLFITEFEVATANHISMLRPYRANKYLKRLIKEFEKDDIKSELAWVYILQSSLYVRRSLNKEAVISLKKAENLYPNSFLIQSAWERLNNNLPFI